MTHLLTTENLIALLTLTALEIVLGIDNVIFIAILSNKLPANQQDRGRQLGIALAVISRILLLLSLGVIIRLQQNVVTILGNGLSPRDLILLVGGLFLIAKSTREIHSKLEGLEHKHAPGKDVATLTSVLLQILILDVVFSLDSVITAVGIADEVPIMILAIVIAAVVMVVFSGAISRFVEQHPTFKILALAFLIMIGALLVIEGWVGEAAEGLHLKNYAYFAMAFSVVVEVLNMRLRKTDTAPVQLHNRPPVPGEGHA